MIGPAMAPAWFCFVFATPFGRADTNQKPTAAAQTMNNRKMPTAAPATQGNGLPGGGGFITTSGSVAAGASGAGEAGTTGSSASGTCSVTDSSGTSTTGTGVVTAIGSATGIGDGGCSGTARKLF